MVANGLLLLTSSTRSVLSSSSLRRNLLAASTKLTAAGVLYVYHWFPPVPSPGSPSSTGSPGASTTSSNTTPEDISSQISRYSLISSKVYSQSQKYCPKLDLRFLFEKSFENNARPSIPIDLVLVETQKGQKDEISQTLVKNFVTQNFNTSAADIEIQFIGEDGGEGEVDESSSNPTQESEACSVPFPRLFTKVAIGGTFDRMHIAHKILITEAALRCSNELIVGVTDDDMIKSELYKVLLKLKSTKNVTVTLF